MGKLPPRCWPLRADGVLACLVRDSKDPAGPAPAFTPAHWRAFAARVKAGGLDLP